MLDRQPLLISMLVTPYCTNLFENPQELYQYLLEVKQQCLPKKSLKILSISQEIPLIDPLAVLQAIAKPDQLHFYFEKPAQKEAIAAIDAVDFIKIEGEDRFKKAQAFIQSCLTKTTSIGAFNVPVYWSPFFFFF
jgi:menaquinone-specific isochorismate synthase